LLRNDRVKKGAQHVGHEIKENTELAEHGRGIHDVKNDATSVVNKMKNAISIRSMSYDIETSANKS